MVYCSIISIGSARQLTEAANLFCRLATRFETASPPLKPFKIEGSDCIIYCNRNDLSVNISIECDVGKSPKNKQIGKVNANL